MGMEQTDEPPTEEQPYDRYAEHDRVEREGGTCSCGATYPAPGEAAARVAEQ